MFGKSIEDVMRANKCEQCLHNEICHHFVRLEIEGGKCSHFTESKIVTVYKDGYDIKLRVGARAFMIKSDKKGMRVECDFIHSIIITGSTVRYLFNDSKKGYIFGENVFMTEEEAENKLKKLNEVINNEQSNFNR